MYHSNSLKHGSKKWFAIEKCNWINMSKSDLFQSIHCAYISLRSVDTQKIYSSGLTH